MKTVKIQINLEGFDYKSLHKYLADISTMELLTWGLSKDSDLLIGAHIDGLATIAFKLNMMEELGKLIKTQDAVYSIDLTVKTIERIIEVIKEYRTTLNPITPSRVIEGVELFLNYLESLTLETNS